MKVNFKLFSVKPDNLCLVPLSAGSHVEYADDHLDGSIVVRYAVTDMDKFTEGLDFDDNGVSVRGFTSRFSAEITYRDEVINANLVEVCKIAFGAGEYEVRYEWTEMRKDGN